MKPESHLGAFFNANVQNGETLRRLALNRTLNELDIVLDALPVQPHAPLVASDFWHASYRIDSAAQGIFGSGAPKDIRTTKPYDIVPHPNDASTIVASRLTRFSTAPAGRAPIDKLMSGKSEGTTTVPAVYYLFAMQADSAQGHMGKSEEANQTPDKAPAIPYSFNPSRFELPTRGDYLFGIVRRGSDMQAFTFKQNPRFGEVVPVIGGGSDALSSELSQLGPIDRKYMMVDLVDLSAELAADITAEVTHIKEAHKAEQRSSRLHRLRTLMLRKTTTKPKANS